MKLKKSHISNIITIAFIALLIIPQTRKPIQLALNRVVAMFSSVDTLSEKKVLEDYEWSLKDDKGNEVNFESLKGKVILVNLWATWCPPCIAELPSMEKLYNDYGNQVTFLFISNENQSVTEQFLAKRKIVIPSYMPTSVNPPQLSSNSIPATYIIDKDGMIQVRKIGAANWNSDGVRKLLDELIAQ